MGPRVRWLKDGTQSTRLGLTKTPLLWQFWELPGVQQGGSSSATERPDTRPSRTGCVEGRSAPQPWG